MRDGREKKEMTYLKIYCGKCHKTWDVFENQISREDNHICPHCGEEVDRPTWMQYILPALGTVADANRELYKDYLGYSNKTLFKFDVIGETFEQTKGEE